MKVTAEQRFNCNIGLGTELTLAVVLEGAGKGAVCQHSATLKCPEPDKVKAGSEIAIILFIPASFGQQIQSITA